jgi:hypothetical protein
MFAPKRRPPDSWRLATLGLSPEATMLAGAAGSIIIKYVNSSYVQVHR